MIAPRRFRRLRSARGALLLAFGAAGATAAQGCVPSNIVAATDRSVVIEPADAAWEPAQPGDLAGCWSSAELNGDLAASVLKVVYWFEGDGRFTGAALMLDADGPTFHVLAGRFTFADGMLRLGADAELATLESAPDLLRLRGPGGEVVLRREALR